MNAIWRLFSSIRFGIYLIILFSIVSLIGSFIMQGDSFFEGMNHEVLFKWIYAYGIANIKLTWWLFVLILIAFILGISTIICNLERLLSLLALKRRLRKRWWLELSSYSMHLGFLIVLMGHLISSATGFKSKGNIVYEGAPIKAPNMEYYVGIDNLNADYYPNGVLKYVESALTIIKDGKVAASKKVTVNYPLAFKGVYFYQVDFGEVVSGANLLIGGKNEGKLYTLNFGERIDLPEKGHSLGLGRLLPDFDMDANGGTYSRSGQFNNPAIELLLYKDDMIIAKKWAFYRNFKGEPFGSANIRAILVGFPTKKYVILDIHKDIGAFIVLTGALIFLFSLGLYFIFKKYKYGEA
ncbi:MAG: cytochrome c biogenesis protein ResB [Nitrospirae bacterium]|nr:cytochrome c biogenesis protein ResB [Nitrospirota bacterium]